MEPYRLGRRTGRTLVGLGIVLEVIAVLKLTPLWVWPLLLMLVAGALWLAFAYWPYVLAAAAVLWAMRLARRHI